MKLKRSLLLMLALAALWPLFIQPAYAFPHGGGSIVVSGVDPTTNIIPSYNDTYANWSNAGLLKSGGIAAIDAARTVQCGSTVAITGVVPPTGSDDSVAINNAITACTAGKFVQLAAGASVSSTASITGTTLTWSSGTGLAVHDVIGGVGVAPGTLVVSGSGTTWTVNINHPVAVGSETMTATVPFLVTQSEYIALNKAITLKGSGACTGTSTPYCSTVIVVYDGAIPDWSISSSTAGANCGVTTASATTCSQGASTILISPSGNFNWGWAGCNLYTNPTTGNCGTTLTADAAQGATTVSVTSTANFSVGMSVLIDESPQVTSVTNPTGGTALEASSEFANAGPSGVGAVMILEGGDIPGSYSFIGTGGGSQENQRLNAEIHKITAIGSGTFTFDTPLTLAFRQSGSHDARGYWPTVQGSTANPFLINAGVENISVLRSAAAGIGWEFCQGCFAKGVETAGWVAGGLGVAYSKNTDIEFSYDHNCFDCENNGAEYAISVDAASTETLVQNNIFVLAGKCMVGRGSNTTVVGYNYGDDTFYMQAVIGDNWMDMCGNGSHYAGTHHWLFEGNDFDNCDSDETHGNAIYHVFIRNHCTGLRSTFVDPSNGKTVNDSTNSCWSTSGTATGCGPLRAAGPMAFDYRFGYVGNVLGLAGATTTGNGWVYKGAFCGGGTCTGGFAGNKIIWGSGWVGAEQPSTDPNLTTGTNPWLFRNCNYDYVNASIADCAGGAYSATIPNSFYLTSAPAFFSAGATATYPWPQITPTASPFVQLNSLGGPGLPAKARFAAGTPFVQP